MELKKPLHFFEQVERLAAHNLIIDDIELAEKILSEINYYRFTGYALTFRKEATDSNFKENTKFLDIYNIYLFDEELKNLLLKYLLIIEMYFRTQISNVFSLIKCINPPHDQHYDINNYYRKKDIEELHNSIAREIKYHKDSLVVKHHKTAYGNKMPLWVLVELISFSNLSKYYNSLYNNDQEAICYSVGIQKKYLANWLHAMSVLRNICAHGGRIYNNKLNPPVAMSKGYLKANPHISNDSLMAYAIILQNMLPSNKKKEEFKKEFHMLIHKYEDKVNLSILYKN